MLRSLFLLQKIPKAYLLLFLILLAGIAEGIGLSVLVPLASTLTSGADLKVLPAPFNSIERIFNYFSLAPSFEMLSIVTFFIMLSSFFLIYVQDIAIAKARANLLEEMRNRAQKLIFNSKWEYWSNYTSGDIANIVLHESEKGSESLLALVNLVAISVQLTIYLIVAFLLSWKMTLVALVVIGVAAILAIRLIKNVRKYGKLTADSNTSYSKYFIEFMRGAKLVKAIGVEPVIHQQLSNLNNLSATTFQKIMANSSKMRFELQALIGFAMILVLYTAVSVLHLETAIILVFMLIVMRLAPKFVVLQGQYHSFSAHYPSYELFENTLKKCEEYQEENQERKINFDERLNTISFQNVSYAYPTRAALVVNKVNFKINAKDFIALVGRSGSGKTTTLDLIMGLISPLSGKIEFNQKDLRQLERKSIQKKIGYVSQESIFFSGTILENLKFGFEVSSDKIWNALEIAQLSEMVKNLPEGLETQVGEAGMMLSGGQKQRLAIARALIREPELLVLDEATSALDSESEQAFQKSIDSVAKHFTIIVVAHRLSTIKKATKILVFDEGKIVQEGGYKELSQDKGLFQYLKDIQQEDH